ncbi:T9SS type A sorting domain-containing protein [Hymenobacter cellulosilyticus]|uniref:T9SS type A sorting domain-containing protein n=1 Tax=Hymenobacter cellulosilyticus TaxID=2932248 RepID=A0A8T9QCR9_9BACT|nr:T9SS type A sorting domain-containing protein [Hymenobacter cellulosilyticus]UOQ73908.1 T9SS type A sorting domain-containing protein [Hymenobacter cellulosilyticus]
MTNWYKTGGAAQHWRKLALAALLAGGSAAAQAQGLDYAASAAQNLAGTYTDLGTTGTAITMANNDDANSAVIPIGFSFTFNRTVFTDFTVNTNGFIKMGTTAPSAANITNYIAAPDLNIIAPLGGIDLAGALNQTTSPTEFRVATTGVAGSRVCTIQWENLADKTAQFATIQFQAKLYEGTNRIEFVYGTWTAGTAAPLGVGFLVGLKGSSSQFTDRLFAQKASSATAWTTTVFATESGGLIPSHFARNTFLPDAGRTYRFTQVACAPAAGVYITPTATTAQVVFSGPSNGAGYSLIYGPTGFNPATGGTTVAATASPANLTGLSPATSYQVYIRTNCSATEQSPLAGPFALTTLCSPVAVTTFPYTENFDGVASGTLPCGIVVANTNADSVSWKNRRTVPGGAGPIVVAASGVNGLTYYYNEDGATPGNDWFYTPPLLLRTGNRYQLSFKYRNSGSNYTEKLEVKYGTSASPAGQTATLWKDEAIAAPAFLTAGATSTIPVVPIVPTATGNYYIGFHVYSDADKFFLAIDDLQVTATAITGTSAALDYAINVFPNPSAGFFNVEIKGANAKGAMQVEVLNSLGQIVHSASVRDNQLNKLDLSNLAGGMYVLKVKSGNDFSVRNISIQK